MIEYAMFIRRLLGPCETELFSTADNFAKKYAELSGICPLLDDHILHEVNHYIRLLQY